MFEVRDGRKTPGNRLNFIDKVNEKAETDGRNNLFDPNFRKTQAIQVTIPIKV